MSTNFNKLFHEIDTEIENAKVDESLNLFINKITNNKDDIINEKQIREICYNFLGKDKIFGSISKINEELLQKLTNNDKSEHWIIYYLIYYSGQLYPYLYTHLLYNNILDNFLNELKQIPINKNELEYQSILRILYKIAHLHKLSNRDLELFNEEVIDILLEFIEHTRNYHDENVNYSIIEFLVVISHQIQNRIKDKNNKTTIKYNAILTSLEKRINNSKTLSENFIFILNRTADFSVKYYILKFLYLIFSTPSLDKFFYTNDIPVLLDVTLRELWNLTDENTHIQKGYLVLLEKLIQYTINHSIPYRYPDITKLLYAISQRSQNTCYSNEKQHAKLVALSNIANRILKRFDSILDVSTMTKVRSEDNIVALNKSSSTSSSPSSAKPIKERKPRKKAKSATTTPTDKNNIDILIFEKGKRPNPLNKIKPLEKVNSVDEEEIDNNNNNKEKEKENNVVVEENNVEENNEDNENESKDHEKLSQRAMDIFLKSYQQYHENNNNNNNNNQEQQQQQQQSTNSSSQNTLKNEIEDEVVPISPVNEDKDHEKLSQRAMDIFLRSYQQYQENNQTTSFNENSNIITNQTTLEPISLLEEGEGEREGEEEEEQNENNKTPISSKDHEKLSERAMNIFLKSIQQYNNEQETIHSASLPPTYSNQEEKEQQQQQQQQQQQEIQDDIYSANSYFPHNHHDTSNCHPQSTSNNNYNNNNNNNNNYNYSSNYNENDNISTYSTNSNSNSTISNTSFPIPTRYDSHNKKHSMIDPIERTHSPFSDNYQISSQIQYQYQYQYKNNNNNRTKNSNPVASPALSASSYYSNYSSSSVSKPYYQTKPTNIFKKDNTTNISSPLNYTSNSNRKASYSSVNTTSSSYSPYLNNINISTNPTTNKINNINNIFNMDSNIIDDPVERHQSPFDDSFSIE
ncbi:hypothetical protein BCR32DRAFT_289546 [Anaeromyces robustus]|uniref:SPIN90/Ldb17 leucine-rich domain-containing protein n=1 Tax=Anaeromyces robustus TaxID=1754192 RepID=A0A1Y1XN28_9FUNG|nr:hypothetical protein BCR32DRAFT_289546 [Anaeromyces robustus]|eukprot:ORX87149.1 hypothetical protein BCR32DRAFT_289546 [Anaeromyces robustus]